MKKLIVICAIVILIPISGYITNIVRFCRCDFQEPYKTEVIRGIGIAIPPIGAIVGYVNIED